MLKNDPFEGKKEINIVFLGGSITEGACSSSPDTCYFGLCREWFKNAFPEQNVNCFNAGIGGTGSDFGMVRMDRDVMCHNPDMLFVEFAVNDAGKDRRAYMESIVRKAMSQKEIPYIVFLYTTNKLYSTITEYHEEVAQYYGIPQINLRDALKKELGGKDPLELGLFNDGVHPLDGGFRIYGDTIISRLEDGTAFVKPQNKAPMCENTPVINAVFTPSTKFEHSALWECTTRHRGYDCLLSENPGETVTFEFDGNFLAMETGLHKESGVIDVEVDGELIRSVQSYYNTTSYQCVYQEVSYDLPLGHHNVKLTLKENPSSEHPGSKFMIYHIITGNVNYTGESK